MPVPIKPILHCAGLVLFTEVFVMIESLKVWVDLYCRIKKMILDWSAQNLWDNSNG